MTAALGRVLGLAPGEVRELARHFVQRRGRAFFTIRALALLVAASRPARSVLPRAVRLRALRPFLHELLWSPAENLVYLRREERP
jgi:hypothetical protein